MQVTKEGVASFQASATIAPYLRVKYDSTDGLALAGPEDKELGTTQKRHIVSGLGASEQAAVVLANAQGTVQMTAAGALSAFDTVYGAEGGKIDDTPNANPVGIALEAATADGDQIEVLRLPVGASSGDEVGGLEIFDDFIGDFPAAATALTGNTWTKVETDGLGVTSVDVANGVLKLAFDAVAEAATAALYMANSPFDINQNPIVEFRAAVYDIGDHAALDINFGVAGDTHATDADAIVLSAFFHLDGSDLSLLCECDDGTNETAAVDSGVDLVDDTWYDFKVDLTDISDVTFWYRAIGATVWTRLCSSTTFSVAAATGTITPIMHVEKTSNDTTADVRVDWIRGRCERVAL